MNIVTTYHVAGMTCDHCTMSVAEEVSLVAGVDDVAVDLASGIVTVSSTTTPDQRAIASAVEEAGYELVS
jgi:copper chaperone CopZ